MVIRKILRIFIIGQRCIDMLQPCMLVTEAIRFICLFSRCMCMREFMCVIRFFSFTSSSLHLAWRHMHGTHQTPKSCIKDLLASCNIISFVSRSSPDTTRYTESITLDLHSALILPISNYLPLNNFHVPQFFIPQNFTLNRRN